MPHGVAARRCRSRQASAPRLDFDGRFAQTSVRLDIERLETLCSRWLNFPLDRPLRFELQSILRRA